MKWLPSRALIRSVREQEITIEVNHFPPDRFSNSAPIPESRSLVCSRFHMQYHLRNKNFLLSNSEMKFVYNPVLITTIITHRKSKTIWLLINIFLSIIEPFLLLCYRFLFFLLAGLHTFWYNVYILQIVPLGKLQILLHVRCFF